MKKQIFLSLTTFIVLALLSFGIILISHGILKPVKFIEKELGPFNLCAIELKGDFKQAKKAGEKTFGSLKDYDINSQMGMGIYYDNPKTTPKEKCRFVFGSIIPSDAVLNSETKEYLIKKSGYIIKEIPKQKYLITEFSYKNEKLLLLMIGIMKGYPGLNKVIEDKKMAKSEIYELYDMSEKGKETFSILYPLTD